VKIATSNIAWPHDQDAAVADALAALGVSAIEVAPTKVWSAPLSATDHEIGTYRHVWKTRGIQIVAAQSLLFGRPDLTLFDEDATREQTLAYLQAIIRICGRLGVGVLVFGSPQNRRAGNRDRAVVWQQAIDFFGQLGTFARSEGTAVAIEANPPEYGADFITRAAEALDLVRAVNHSGFRLHLDTACMTLAGDDPAVVIRDAGAALAHFHVSEPYLAPIGRGQVAHRQFAQQLAAAQYDGWVSIEMRQADPFEVQGIAHAVQQVRQWYLS
jgi:sugar phosphate isomerase/epimerase